MAEKRERDSSEAIRKHLMQYGANKESPAYLVRGAELICSQGTNKRMMNLNKCHGVYIKEHAVVHELDCIQGDEENITWFGVCNPGEGLETDDIELIGDNGEKCHGKKCKPYLIGTWQESFERTRIVDNGNKKQEDGEEPEGCNTITTDSFLVCKYGGIITPINSGQDREVSADEFDYDTEEEREAALARVQEPCEEEIDREEGCEDLLHAKLGEDDEWSEHGSVFESGSEKLEEGACVMLNEWLQAYRGKTCDEDGRRVLMPDGIIPNKWAMLERLSDINKYAKLEIGDNEVIAGQYGELIDKEGRYWVAVEPNVMNPNHKKTDDCMADEMNYGTKIDVVIIDNWGNKYYVPCVVGDCKAHTYPTGIYQTGDGFPNGEDSHPENKDYSVVEFCGKAPISNLDNYEIEEIIVYD